MDLEKTWQKVLSLIELEISKANFHTWLKDSQADNFEDGVFFIGLTSNFAKEWVKNKYSKLILKYLRELNPEIRAVEYVIKTAQVNNGYQKPKTIKKKDVFSSKIQPSFQEVDKDTGLNPRYRLDNFIVSSFNELAFAAANAIIENPGIRYNPFFLYGGVGLGKTHLIQAIGNEITKLYSGKKILYTSSEKFTNEVVSSIRFKTTQDFRNKYRTIDILIIDDIQFIGGKERTKEEFFHTFNELHENNKQIILSSDRPPASLKDIEDRLRSRFEGGIIADISKPDFETRVAILNQKMKENDTYLSEDVVEIIAKKIQDNIRNLEGALNLIYNNIKYKKVSPTKENIESLLEATFLVKRPLKPKEVIETVSNFYQIPINQILSKSRKKELAKARQIIMYLLREELDMPYLSIGEKIGQRDHTTIIYAYEKIKKELKKNPLIEEEINLIKEKIYKG